MKVYHSQAQYSEIMFQAQKGYGRALEPVCRECGLTRNEMDVLLYLYDHPGKDRASDVVTGRGMSKSHVSMSVGNLLERGYLMRYVDESDRRTVHLKLTQAAQFAAQLGRQAQEQFFAQLFRGFSDSDMARWRELNHKICHNISQLE